MFLESDHVNLFVLRKTAERKVSSMNNRVKLLLLGLLTSIALFFISFLIWNLITFPLSRQNVDGKIEGHSILAFQEEAGILVFITETSRNYAVHIFAPSMILNRYRLQTKREFNSTFITVVPGRFRYFVLEADSAFIEFIHTNEARIKLHHILGFFSFIVVTMSIKYRVYQFYFKRKL